MSRFDANMDGRLGYWEFSNMFMPQEPRHRRDLETRRAKGMTVDVEHKIRAVIIAVMKAEERMEEIRVFVRDNITEPLREFFHEMDWRQRGFLTASEMAKHFDVYPRDEAKRTACH
jgi:hypothetical protein